MARPLIGITTSLTGTSQTLQRRHAELGLHVGKERAAQARVDKLHTIADTQHRSPFFPQHVKSDAVGLPAVQIDGGQVVRQPSYEPLGNDGTTRYYKSVLHF